MIYVALYLFVGFIALVGWLVHTKDSEPDCDTVCIAIFTWPFLLVCGLVGLVLYGVMLAAGKLAHLIREVL